MALPKKYSLIVGSDTADIVVFLLHGYTSNPNIFNVLAEKCAERLQAFVYAPLLPGHAFGTEDLATYGMNDFYIFADDMAAEIRKMKKKGKKVVVLGDCFGGYLAARIAEHVSIDALIFTSVPFRLRFPLSSAVVHALSSFLGCIPKALSPYTYTTSKFHGGYTCVPAKVLPMLDEGNAYLEEVLPLFTVPILAVNCVGDPLTREESNDVLCARACHAETKAVDLKSEMHSVHTSDRFLLADEHILEWIETHVSTP